MKTKILVVGRNNDILQVLGRLINKNENWEGHVVNNDEAAIALFHQNNFNLVLLSSGINTTSENKLRKIFSLQNPDVIIVQHYGGGSGLLENEIRMALEQKKVLFHIKDNPFA